MLSGGLSIWLVNTFQWFEKKSNYFSCNCLPFLVHLFLDTSVFIIILMTGEKLFASVCPIKARIFNQRFKKSKIACIFILSILINSHFLFSHIFIDLEDLKMENVSIQEGNLSICTYLQYNRFYSNWAIINAFIYSFLPFTILLFFNVCIVCSILKSAKRRKKLSISKFKIMRNPNIKCSFGETCMNRFNSLEGKDVIIDFKREIGKNKKLEILSTVRNGSMLIDNIIMASSKIILNIDKKSVIKTSSKNDISKFLIMYLLLLNFSFLLLSMPIVVVQIIESKTSNTNELTKSIAELFLYLNHSLSFFFYLLNGKTFRGEAIKFMNSLLLRKNKQIKDL